MRKTPSFPSKQSGGENPAQWPMWGLWPRSESGFEWVDGEEFTGLNFRRAGDQWVSPDTTPNPGPWLVPKNDRYGKPYAMLRRRAALLRDIVDLGKNASSERILAFADKWGGLGLGERCVAPDGRVRAGDSFGAWRQSAVRVAVLMGLWRKVKASDTKTLSKLVKWRPDGVIVQIAHVSGKLRPDLITLYASDSPGLVSALEGPGDEFEESVLALKGQDPFQLLKKWTPGEVLEPMRYYVCREVNKALLGKVNRTVLPFKDNRVHYVPNSLLACIYVAFQDVITGAVAGERECQHCGMPFTAKRKNKRYCDDNCAKRAWDEKNRAGEAHDE